jgi:diguanylate cyclase (GGDEF)-like protein/PAS domain S-box-containing protein
MRQLPAPFQILGFLPVLVVINQFGWYGGFPTLVLVLVSLPIMVLSHPAVQLRLAGGDYSRRLTARIALHLLVGVTPALFITGWGPELVLCYVFAAMQHMSWSGSRAWRPAAIFAVLGIGLGLAATATGLVRDYLGSPGSYLICALVALPAFLVIRQLGRTLADREQFESQLGTSRAAARRSERWFKALAQNSSDVVTIVDAAGLVTWVSPATGQQLGHHPADVLGGPAEAIVDPSDRGNFRAFHASVLAEADPAVSKRAEVLLWHADGTPRWHEVTAVNLLDDEEIAGVVLSHRDVHERRAYHELLAFDASHDALTGLVNRAELYRVLDQALVVRAASAAVEPEPSTVAVLFVDLDGFKPVNDVYGHETGDALLAAVARLLERNVLGADTVARIGGDEFAVVLSGIAQERDAIAVAQRVLRALQAPILLPRAQVQLGASIGIALANDGSSAAELLRQADHAMYRAKREGRNRWAAQRLDADGIDVFSQPGPSQAEIYASAIELDLRHALATGAGLSLAYQPIVLLQDRSLWGVEALVRWQHPTRGAISPVDFIPVAERSGAVRELGRWVLEHACLQLAAWNQQLPDERRLMLAVNLSARELDQPGLAEDLLRIVTESGMCPQALVIEVTESALVDPATAIPTLTALSEAGIRIAIDDFGTGYSSLQYLTQMPVDVLKLDRSFVTRLDGSAEHAAIAEAVVRLSETLQLGTVAEGVETEDQAKELAELGYRRGQGYLFARPLTAEQVQRMLDADIARL